MTPGIIIGIICPCGILITWNLTLQSTWHDCYGRHHWYFLYVELNISAIIRRPFKFYWRHWKVTDVNPCAGPVHILHYYEIQSMSSPRPKTGVLVLNVVRNITVYIMDIIIFIKFYSVDILSWLFKIRNIFSNGDQTLLLVSGQISSHLSTLWKFKTKAHFWKLLQQLAKSKNVALPLCLEVCYFWTLLMSWSKADTSQQPCLQLSSYCIWCDFFFWCAVSKVVILT